MDVLTSYYLRKAIPGTTDKFHDHLDIEDIQILQKAAMWVILAPITTLALLVSLKQLRKSAQSNNFESIIQSTATSFATMGGNPEMRVKWPKKNADGSVVEGADESQDWKEIYQQVANERQTQIKSENDKIKEKMDA